MPKPVKRPNPPPSPRPVAPQFPNPDSYRYSVLILPCYPDINMPPPHPDIKGALVFNATTGQVMVCIGDSWSSLIAQNNVP